MSKEASNNLNLKNNMTYSFFDDYLQENIER